MEVIRMKKSLIAFRHLRGEEGSALMAAFWMLVCLLLVGMAATYTTTTEVGLSGNERSEAQLFYLAEAGLAQCKRYLDGLGIPLEGSGTDRTSPVQVYLEEPIGIAGGVSGTFTAYIDPQDRQQGKPTKFLAITVRARLPGSPIVKVVQEMVGQENFAKYSYFTDLETQPSGGKIWFTSNDILRGPVHSNSQFHFTGNPEFYKEVSSAASTIDYWTPSTPTFHLVGQPELGVDSITLPDDTSLIRIKSQEAEGLYFAGDAEVIMGYDPVTDFAYINVDVGLGPVTYQIPENGVLYVNGDCELSGELRGQMTVAASGDVYLMDDITYVDDPRVVLSSTDILGIVSEGNIIVAATAANLDAGDETFMCCLMALNESFTVEDYDSYSFRGYLRVIGGIIQERRGAVGTFGGGGGPTGYSKDYIYDDRLADSPPPSYPTTGTVTTLSWREWGPNYDISINVF